MDTHSGSPDDVDEAQATLYSTSDVDTSAFLAYRGCEPLHVEPPPKDAFPKLARFTFERTAALNAALDEWSSNRSFEIRLRQYLACRKELYSLARAVVRGGGR